MIRKGIKQTGYLLALVFFITALMTGCAVKKNIWGDPKTGLILSYRMPENEVFQYKMSGDETQTVEMMGQTMKNVSKITSKFSLQTKGIKENNLILGITLDDMKMDINHSMLGDLSPELGSLIGKKFEMTLSSLGKELGFSGIESLQYNLGQFGKRNIDSSFKRVFPDLSEKPVKIGDTWTTKAETTEKESGLSIRIVSEGINTLEGMETVNGLECVKIETKITGTLSGEGQQMGADITLKADIKGASTWYFAYKEGILVKMTAKTSSEGAVEVSAQGMSLPLNTESSSEISLVK